MRDYFRFSTSCISNIYNQQNNYKQLQKLKRTAKTTKYFCMVFQSALCKIGDKKMYIENKNMCISIALQFTDIGG